MNRNVVIVTVVVVVLLVVGFLAYRNFSHPSAATGGTVNIDTAGYPMQGNADAKVTVVAFEDFKCPVCKAYDTEIVPQIESQYIQTGKIKYVFIGFPIIAKNNGTVPDDSRLALNAGYCVADQSNKAFFDYAHILFRAQKDETTLWATNDYLKSLAATLDGVDQAKLAQCIDSGANDKKVEAGNSLATGIGASFTPSVYVNGKLAGQTPNDVLPAIAAAVKAAGN